MKIAFIVNQFPSLSETFILNQITGLVDRGHEVDIYPIHPSETAKVHPDVTNYSLLDHTFYYGSALPANRFVRLLKGLGLLFSNFYQAPETLLRSLNIFEHGKKAASLSLLYKTLPWLGKPYNIIHCQFGTLGRIGMLLRHIVAPEAKLITSFRGYDISKHVQQAGDNVYAHLFDSGDLFLSNCEYFKRRLVELGCDPRKIVVHGSGINCSRFVFSPRRPNPDKVVRIVTTGRLVEKKGIEYSIRAIGKLAKDPTYTNHKQAQSRIEYNIIGDGDLREELQQLIQNLELSNSVKLLGWKQQPEIIEILNNSHIFTAPSVTAKDGNQDAPLNVLKEAMAMGLPVVSTRHGGIPELVQDGISGFLVPERDVDVLAEKLAYLVQHPEEWPRMGQAGRAYVEAHYDTNKLNDQLVKIYQSQTNSSLDQELELDLPVGSNAPQTRGTQGC